VDGLQNYSTLQLAVLDRSKSEEKKKKKNGEENRGGTCQYPHPNGLAARAKKLEKKSK